MIHAAAIRYEHTDHTSYYVIATNHADCLSIALCLMPTYVRTMMNQNNQGFLTTDCRFVDRAEAYQIAKAAGQLINDSSSELLDSYNCKFAKMEEGVDCGRILNQMSPGEIQSRFP